MSAASALAFCTMERPFSVAATLSLVSSHQSGQRPLMSFREEEEDRGCC
jgi:hypothetical protein